MKVSISHSVKLCCLSLLFGIELKKNRRISRDYTLGFVGCALYKTTWQNEYAKVRSIHTFLAKSQGNSEGSLGEGPRKIALWFWQGEQKSR